MSSILKINKKGEIMSSVQGIVAERLQVVYDWK